MQDGDVATGGLHLAGCHLRGTRPCGPTKMVNGRRPCLKFIVLWLARTLLLEAGMGAQPLHPAQRTKIMSVVSTRAVVIEGAFLDGARGVWVMAQGGDELGGMCGTSPTCPPCACHREKLKAKMGQGAALGARYGVPQ